MKKSILRILISLTFIGLLFYMIHDDIPVILKTLKNVDRVLFAFSILIALGTVLILAKRLQLIFQAEEVPMKILDSFNLTFIGYFFNNFLPTAVGGDIVKAMCAARITGEKVKSVTSVLMDRVFGLFTFIMIPSLSFLFFLHKIKNPAVPILIYSFLGVALFSFGLLFNRGLARRFQFIERGLNYFHVGEKVREIYDGMHNFKNHKAVMAQAMTLSIFGQSINILVVYVMVLSLGIHTSVIYFYLLVPMVHLISMLPSLNGLGIREGAYVYFLTPVIGREYAAAIGIMWLAMLFFLSFIGGVIYLVRHDYHIRFKEAAAS